MEEEKLKKSYAKLIAILLVSAMLFAALAACTPAADNGTADTGTDTGTDAGTDTDTDAGTDAGTDADDTPAPAGDLMDVGVPRNQTLVVDILGGHAADPYMLNPFLPGAISMDAGFHNLMFANLWEINTQTGEQWPALASEMPRAMDDTYTWFHFGVREGLTWSDGVGFSAEDVVFTGQMILDTPEFGWHGFFTSIVEEINLVDRYTVEVRTVNPEPKLSMRLGVTIWGNTFRPMPMHIWENEDPTSFRFSDPVSIGAYTLRDRDSINGAWFLYERRPDWENSVVGQIVGEPGPQYVLFRFFGSEERRVMGMLNNEIDILQDITPESMEILSAQSEYVLAWHAGFPYAQFDDPCARGILFNTGIEPFDNLDVRWALALSLDIELLSLASFGGMLRVNPINTPPTDVLQQIYHFPMEQWLTEFELEDGYRPFDTSFAWNMVQRLQAEGVEGLPTTEEGARDLFGVGWWRNDPEKATELLERHGFTNSGGSWLMPDGSPFVIEIGAPADFEIQSMRLAFAVAEQWRGFGIDASVRQMDGATFWDSEALGHFDAIATWPNCGILPDTSMNMAGWHGRHLVPVGERASGSMARWSNPRADELIDAAMQLQPDDPQVVVYMTEVFQIIASEIPNLSMFGTSKFVPVNTYYWEGFQTADNPFEGPWWWWSQFKYYLPHYSPTGR